MDKARAVVRGKERLRRREDPEKVMKQWERDRDEAERETTDEDELSDGDGRTVTEIGQEVNGKRGVEIKISSTRDLGAIGKDMRDAVKKQSREPGGSSEGAGEEAGEEVGEELGKRELREIYRRPSDLDQNPTEELVKAGSEEEEESLSEAERRGSEGTGEVDLGETETESTEVKEKDEKEDD